MHHLEIWPSYLTQTALDVSHSWGFSHLETKILNLLGSPKESRRIAQAEQEMYMSSTFAAGGEAYTLFCILVQATKGKTEV